MSLHLSRCKDSQIYMFSLDCYLDIRLIYPGAHLSALHLDIQHTEREREREKCWHACGEIGAPMYTWGNMKWCSHSWKQQIFKKSNIELTYDLVTSFASLPWMRYIQVGNFVCLVHYYITDCRKDSVNIYRMNETLLRPGRKGPEVLKTHKLGFERWTNVNQEGKERPVGGLPRAGGSTKVCVKVCI